MKTSISLGWNCYSASKAVDLRLRPRKSEGYLTGPFDECISNYRGIILCLSENFKYFYDSNYLEIISAPFSIGGIIENEKLIFNKRYRFIFNHESPGHANLYLTQNWPNGINHYIENDYKLFKERYEKRVNNFRDYLKVCESIVFVISRFSSNMKILNDTIKGAFPTLKYNIIHLEPNQDRNNIEGHLKLMGLSELEIEEEMRFD